MIGARTPADSTVKARALYWDSSRRSRAQLRKRGYRVIPFRVVRSNYIEPARSISPRRVNLDNAAAELLRLLTDSPKLAIVGVPAETVGDLELIYSFLVEPSFRRNVTLLLGVDRPIEALDPSRLVDAEMGYPWTYERLLYINERYLRTPRQGDLPPLTPIEEQLLSAMREQGLAPRVQYGIGGLRVDFAFPSHRLAVEADGRAWHDALRDAARDEHLRRLGWEVVRFTGSHIHRDPKDIVEKVQAVLEARHDFPIYSDLDQETDVPPWWRRFLNWLLRRDRGTARASSRQTLPEVRPALPGWKRSLDKNQRQAIDAHEGVVQVIAPAGSGKTTTLVARVQELLSRGVAANRILCSTYNRATRVELEDRLNALGIRGVDVLNFHALGRRILEQEGSLRSDIGTISYGQWRWIARKVLATLSDAVWLDPGRASELVSNYKLARLWDPGTAVRAANDQLERTAAAIYSLYENELESAQRNDFDDLILQAVRLLQQDERARRRWQDRWECVLVDEYQDIEPAQELLIRLVAAPEDSLFVVGDEDQCIYSWRRASVERIVMLDVLYPGLERVVLDTSYRCPPKIINAAKSLIGMNQRRFRKSIRASSSAPEPGEVEVRRAESLASGAKYVAGLLRRAPSPDKVVVLARTSRLLREVVRACVDEDVAIRAPVTALHPTDAEQTVLAYVRLTSAPETADLEDIRRSFRVPNRYLPPEGEEIVVSRLRAGSRFPDAGQWFSLGPGDGWRKKRIEEWGKLCDSLASISSAERALQHLRKVGGLDVHYSSVEQMTPHDQIEVEELDDLSNLARGIDVVEFVRRLEDRTARLSNINDENGIELTTIHGAKGREWEKVVLFGANADQLPHFRSLADAETKEDLEEALEDERRLAYVAMTRAKRGLTIVVAGKEASPFLREADLTEDTARLPTIKSIEAARPRASGARDKRDRARAVSGAPKSVPTLRAKYRGKCGVCGKVILPGQPITGERENWIHASCVTR